MTTARSFGATDDVQSAAFTPPGTGSVCFFVKGPSVGDTTSRGLMSMGFSPYISVNASEFGGGTPTAGSIYWSHSWSSADRRIQVASPGLTWANWNHLAFTWDGSSTSGAVKVYANGVLLTNSLDVNAVGTIDLTSSKVTAGNRNSGSQGFTGSMAFFSLHNAVLTQAQVQAHMNTGVQTTSRILSWDLGSGSPETDGSGNGHSGTVSGTSVVSGPSLSTTYTQTISASGTGTATMVRRTALTRSATGTGTATMTRRTAKPLAVAATGTATLIRQARKTLAATGTGTATMAVTRLALVTLSVAATGTTTMVRKTSKALAVSATVAPALVKRTAKTLAASATGTASMATLKVVLVTLSAAATGTATLVKRTGKTLAAAATSTPTLAKRTAKTLAASAGGTATLVKQPRKSLAAAATGTVSMVRRIGKLLGYAATGTPTLTTIGGSVAPPERGTRAEAIAVDDRSSVGTASSTSTRRV